MNSSQVRNIDVWWENAAMAALESEFKDRICILPQRSLNAYPANFLYHSRQGKSALWHPGDFVIHSPGRRQAYLLTYLRENGYQPL